MAEIPVSRTINLNGRLRARVQPGPGEVVFWIHGYTIDSSLWTELWNKLPAWSHVGVDLPGHGESSPAPATQTLESLGEELALAAISLDTRHVVGLSLGSMIALQVVLSRPRSFSTLCLAAPALAGGPVDPDVRSRYAHMGKLLAALGPGPWMRELWMTSPPDLFRYAVRNPGLRDRLVNVIDRYRWEEFTGPGVARMTTETQAIGSLGGIKSRTLVLIGEHEFKAFRQTAEILEAVIPSCSILELADTGHLCILEALDDSAGAIAAHFRGTG